MLGLTTLMGGWTSSSYQHGMIQVAETWIPSRYSGSERGACDRCGGPWLPKLDPRSPKSSSWSSIPKHVEYHNYISFINLRIFMYICIYIYIHHIYIINSIAGNPTWIWLTSANVGEEHLALPHCSGVCHIYVSFMYHII